MFFCLSKLQFSFTPIIFVFTIQWVMAQNTSPLPTTPIGVDAYLQWDHIPYQRLGMRAYMRSTYDRTGNNRTADASHYLYQESDTFNVSLDVKSLGGLNMTIPFAGHPVGKAQKKATNELDLINSAYRFLFADYFPFGKRAVINLNMEGKTLKKNIMRE